MQVKTRFSHPSSSLFAWALSLPVFSHFSFPSFHQILMDWITRDAMGSHFLPKWTDFKGSCDIQGMSTWQSRGLESITWHLFGG